jgi:hypothetical protein
MAGAKVIIRVVRADAIADATDPAALAERWAKAISDALALPPVKIDAAPFVIGVGKSMVISLVGGQARDAEISTDSDTVLAVRRTPAGLLIRGLTAGQAIVAAQAEKTVSAVEVTVKPYAATFPQTIDAEVVGAPTSAATVKSVILGVIRAQTEAVPGASCRAVGELKTSVLLPGEDREFQTRVRAEAPGALPAEGIVTVRVRNPGFEMRREAELWYCNQPERVAATRTLFRGTLTPDRPVRLLYHHINVGDGPLVLRADLINTSALTARVIIIPGDAPPNSNPVLAGLDAATSFLSGWLSGSGEVVTIPPGTSRPLAFRRLAPGRTASGLCYLRLLAGGPPGLRVRVMAADLATVDTERQQAPECSTPWRLGAPEPLPEGKVLADDDAVAVYPNPFRRQSVDFRVGGNFAFVRIGQDPLPGKSLAKPLDGDFGVVYEIDATAENPTDKPADIEVVFESSAGYSGGLFVIDGDLRRLSPLQPDEQISLLRFHLDPGQTRQVKLLTIPLSGSCYPATVMLRPLQPNGF